MIKNSQSGFTIIEAAIVVVIGGMLLTAAASMLSNYMLQARISTTKSRMQDIDNAIIQYLNINGVLPCVASWTAQQDTAGFGVEVTDPAAGFGGAGLGQDCNSGAPGTSSTTAGVAAAPTGGYISPLALPGTIVTGAVPVRSLNLPDQDIADAWGTRFTYAITDALTMTSPTMGYDQSEGAIAVIDSTGNFIAPSGTGVPSNANPSAQYVIVSYGADHAGGYTLSGSLNSKACPAGTLETLNCTFPTTTFRSTMVNSNVAGALEFDDYVLFHSLIASTGTVPKNMVAPFGLAAVGPCPSGWINFGSNPIVAGQSCIPCGNLGAGQAACPGPGPGLPNVVICCVKQ